MITNQLNYSPLTDKVYWVNGKGQQKDKTQNFFQMILCWILKASMPMPGETTKRTLDVNGETHWEITIKRIK